MPKWRRFVSCLMRAVQTLGGACHLFGDGSMYIDSGSLAEPTDARAIVTRYPNRIPVGRYIDRVEIHSDSL